MAPVSKCELLKFVLVSSFGFRNWISAGYAGGSGCAVRFFFSNVTYSRAPASRAWAIVRSYPQPTSAGA